MSLRDAWENHAEEWIRWARAPGHDTYWRFHRDAFLQLLPLPGHLTLDIGCGEGRLSRDLCRRGHKTVAIDVSPGLAAAAATHPETRHPVLVGDAAALPFPAGCADLAVAFMSLQDVDQLEDAVSEVGRVVRTGGRFSLATVHPANSAGRFDGRFDDTDPPFVIRRSWFERRRTTDTVERNGLSMTFHSEHRPLQSYTDALAAAGFLIEQLREVSDPDPQDRWHRMPLFLHILAVRK
jgi:SAM-dependent methyltransferase